ncbi:hypothetical protein MMC07_002728 [Pseudocyphellaria aurata]|nr:hypothetical protein [Pseudocyphellaria aurata]
MGSYSPYSINEAEPSKWRPGEEIAASAFVGMTLYLLVEVNFIIYRAFKKRHGLYFWSMQIGTLGNLMATVGTILKYFGSPSTDVIWPLYTFFIVVGWGIYTTAQSLVLYSRLHLVMRNPRIQRYILYLIVATIFIFVIPHLVTVWPALNTSDHEMSTLWSPRQVIVERCTQIGYTVTESIISGLYIRSLVPLLKLKANVRQRRVMIDLLYVNVVVIAFDILQVAFEYTNQLGFSQPLQNFSYILKLRLEFLVLNQLMDVAARGMRSTAFGKDRYYRTPDHVERFSHDNAPSQGAHNSHLHIQKDSFEDQAQSIMSSSMPLPDALPSPKPIYHLGHANRLGSGVQPNGPDIHPNSSPFDHISITDQEMLNSDRKLSTQTARPGARCFDKLPGAVKHFTHHSSGPSTEPKLLKFKRADRSHIGNSGDNGDDEQEIELHMWERHGTAVTNIPWFLTKVEV